MNLSRGIINSCRAYRRGHPLNYRRVACVVKQIGRLFKSGFATLLVRRQIDDKSTNRAVYRPQLRVRLAGPLVAIREQRKMRDYFRESRPRAGHRRTIDNHTDAITLLGKTMPSESSERDR